MAATELPRRFIAKPWGRHDIPAEYGWRDGGGEPLGEIWFEPRPEDALLVKYLFTADRLSVQVHPDDDAARAAGHPRGKDEAWVVLAAEPGATIGLGPKQATSRDGLRAAALDGTIEALLDWRPVAAGETLYSPAGTVHAIGPGLHLLEIQQNLDLTFRLFDYGRPRALHVEEAIAVVRTEPWRPGVGARALAPGRTLLASSAFTVERWGAAGRVGGDGLGPVWVVPLKGEVRIDGEAGAPASAWVVDAGAELELREGAEAIIAYAGGDIRPF